MHMHTDCRPVVDCRMWYFYSQDSEIALIIGPTMSALCFARNDSA